METHHDIALSPDERVVRSYHCSKLRFPKCDGYLTVTSRRVIFHGRQPCGIATRLACARLAEFFAGPFMSGLLQREWREKISEHFRKKMEYGSRITNEVQLQGVTGVSCFYGSQLSIWRLVFGLLALYCGYAASQPSDLRFYFASILNLITAVLVVAGIFILFHCYRKVFLLRIFAAQSNAPIEVGGGFGSLGGNHALFALAAAPTEETDRMSRELGALIEDVKSIGDLCAERWRA